MSASLRRVVGYKIRGYLNPALSCPTPLVSIVDTPSGYVVVYPSGVEEPLIVEGNFADWAQQREVTILDPSSEIYLDENEFLYAVSESDILLGSDEIISRNISLRLSVWSGSPSSGVLLAQFVGDRKLMDVYNTMVRQELSSDQDRLGEWDRVYHSMLQKSAEIDRTTQDAQLELIDGAEFLRRIVDSQIVSGVEVHDAEKLGRIYARATILNSKFINCDFSGARFDEQCTLIRSSFKNCNFTNVFANYVVANEAELNGCDLQGANLYRIRLARSVLESCIMNAKTSFAEADLTSARLQGLRGTGISFYRAFMSDSSLEGAEFVKCNFQNAILLNARLEGAVFWESDFLNANFEEADVRDVDFAGAFLIDARFWRARNVHHARFDRDHLEQAGFEPQIRQHLTRKAERAEGLGERGAAKADDARGGLRLVRENTG